MNLTQALKRLESAGTEQNRKVYARHGVRPPMFGVSFGEINKLAREIKRDQALAEALWATGNHDARILATKIADPAVVSAATLSKWLADCSNYVVTDALSQIAGASPHAGTLMRDWRASSTEWQSTAGWNLFSQLAERAALDTSDLSSAVEAIEKSIHSSPNRTRYAMVLALICIGLRGGSMRELAESASRRIGTVEVDHGETGCETPEIVPYIAKTLEYRAKRAAKTSAPAKTRSAKSRKAKKPQSKPQKTSSIARKPKPSAAKKRGK